MSTADEVISALRSAHNLRDVGEGKYRSASPYRTGSDSDAFSLTIDGPEHGKWFDHVADKGGSLYQLAKHLGVTLPKIAPSIDTKTATTHEGYAESHGLTLEALRLAGWTVGEHQRRPCFVIDTVGGVRYRYIDGNKPVFKSMPGYKQCLYKFTEAIDIANKGGFPLVLCNGEASTVAAQSHGVAAFSVTGGGEKAMPEALLEDVRKAYTGEIVIAMDCDSKGKTAAAALRTQLRSVGYKVRVVNLGLSDKGDLADFMRLWSADDLYNLEDVYDLEFVSALPTIYSAAEMQKEDVAPVEYIVDDIMTTGCYILAGAPKSRKSFLALHLAVAVATGTEVFKTFEVKTKCSVLYLDLEMSKNSVHRRLSSMNFGDWPKNLYFGFNQDWPNRGVLAGQDLENRLDNNPDIRVVIIDVLAQWREPVDPRTPVYSSDYDALKQIQRIAQRRNIVIIVVHHTNKTKITKDDNPFDKISGSTGISGAVDAMWLLTRDPENEFVSILRMTDRNIAGVDRVDLQWDTMIGSHVVDPKSKVLAATGPERRAVYDEMASDTSYSWSPKELAKKTGREEPIIQKHLRRLLEDKLIQRVGYGRYSIVPLIDNGKSGKSSNSGMSGMSGKSSNDTEQLLPNSDEVLPTLTNSYPTLTGGFEALESTKPGNSYHSERISINGDILAVLGQMKLSSPKVHSDLLAKGFDVSLSDVTNALNDLVKQKELTYEDSGTLRRYSKAHA
jgi:hypothetical protein